MVQGEFFAVMGASGSGKSTILYGLSGLEKPTSGKVWLIGKSLEDITETELLRLRLTSIGYVFQQEHLLRNLNIADNIMLPACRAAIESRGF